jgi:GT2 family glycosyltransferase
MNEPPALTVVIGFRDRAIDLLERCLASLANQTVPDLEVVVVDYGSAPAAARAAQATAGKHPFCRYVYSETRGYPWSRSRALNVGVRRAESAFVMTTDVDMIFPPDFVAVLLEHAAPDRVLYCSPYYLPQHFDDWAHLERHLPHLERGDRSQYGGCQCVPTALMQQIRGFDEYYRYWGIEDIDLNHRLKLAGLREVWLNDHTHLFHQWHPHSGFRAFGLMPVGAWGRIQQHRMRHQNEIARNAEDWGQVHAASTRPAFQFLDFDAQRVIPGERCAVFDEPPHLNQSVGKLVRTFWDLPAGHALAVRHAAYPARSRAADRIIRYGNRWLGRAGAYPPLDYAHNLVHLYLAELVEDEGLVADYYLNFPAMDGVSVLVRGEAGATGPNREPAL